MRDWRKRLVLSLAAAALYSLIGYLAIWTGAPEPMPFLAGLVLLPMGIASVITAFRNPHGTGGIWRDIQMAWLGLSIVIVLSGAVFAEGLICLVMASPLLFGFAALGAALTHGLLRRYAPHRVASVFAVLPFVFLPLEPFVVWTAQSAKVTTEIEIAAPPAAVWAQTVEIPLIAPEDLPWTVSHGLLGLPRPVDARLPQGSRVRQLRWTKGIHFEEVLTNWQQNRALTWRFRFTEASVPDEIDRHIKVESRYLHLEGGGYVLTPLPGGGTRLTLTTHYVVTSPFNPYFSLWGRLMLSDFHTAVLTVIKTRAEAG